MIPLVLAALTWLLLHLVVAGPLRPALVSRLGRTAYLGLFSVLSALALAALIWTYRTAPYVEIWETTSTLALIPILVMPVALLFLVGSLRPGNPTMAGTELTLKGELPVAGFIKVTRHPMLWSFTLWAATHMIANGDIATWLMAGTILVTALNGMRSIDRKRALEFSDRWQRFAAKTSIIPLAAVMQGRIRLRASDIGFFNILISAVVYAGLMWWHATLFGVPVYHP